MLYIATNVSSACKARRAREKAEQRREQAAAEKAAKRAKREAETAEKQVAADMESGQRNDGTPGASAVAQETPASRSGMPNCSIPKALGIRGNNAFAGQTVAFTGTLPNMPRAAAIAAVVANGGKAWELNALWYDYSESLDVKRQQIAGAMTFYDRLGTPYAVLSAVKAVYGDGMLSEWFEYGGDPYHFKVFTTNSTALTENKSKFLALLSAVKSLRSVLDSVTYYGAEGKGEYTIGTKVNGAAGAVYAVAEVI